MHIILSNKLWMQMFIEFSFVAGMFDALLLSKVTFHKLSLLNAVLCWIHQKLSAVVYYAGMTSDAVCRPGNETDFHMTLRNTVARGRTCG